MSTSNFSAMGLPSAQGSNAFNWRRVPEPAKPLTGAERNRINAKERYRAKSAEKRTAEILVVNKNTYAPTTKECKGKAARLRGNSFQGTAT